jgi:hypothetical protein
MARVRTISMYPGHVWLVSELFKLAETKGKSCAEVMVECMAFQQDKPDVNLEEICLTVRSNLYELPDKV